MTGYPMNRFSHISINPFALLVLLVLVWAGCDSTDPADEDPTDAEDFVGTWTVTEVFINNQDVSALVFSQITEIEAQFGSDGTFNGVVVQEDGERSELVATYTLDEGADEVTFTGEAFEVPATLDYSIENENRIVNGNWSRRIVLESDDAAFLSAFADTDFEALFGDVNSIGLVLTR